MLCLSQFRTILRWLGHWQIGIGQAQLVHLALQRRRPLGRSDSQPELLGNIDLPRLARRKATTCVRNASRWGAANKSSSRTAPIPVQARLSVPWCGISSASLKSELSADDVGRHRIIDTERQRSLE